jgi:hypothetical protein
VKVLNNEKEIMNDTDFVTTIKDSFYDLADSIVAFMPKLVVALLLLLIGVVVARVTGKLINAALSAIEKNKYTKKFFDAVEIKMVSISDMVGLFVRYAVLLIFVNAAVGVLGLEVLSETFDAILAFVPKIFAAVVVAGLALVASGVVQNIVSESANKAKIKSYKTLANAARILVLVFGFPLAAAQLGLDLTIINNNITVVMAGVMLAFAIAFGLGGRDTAGKIVDNAYKNFKK